MNMVLKDMYQNPYIFIDATSWGFSGENIQTWEVIDNHLIGIVYRYYNSLQLFFSEPLNDEICIELAQFIRNGRYEMISGKSEIIECVYKYLYEEYDSMYGCIMGFEGTLPQNLCKNVQVATISDLSQAAKLVCSDANIGAHYTVPQLTKQFEERMNYSGCINVVYKDKDKVVSHAATYADMEQFAIIGGIVTDSAYRGRGLAKHTTNFLVSILQKNNKLPIVYCYEQGLYNWYNRLGFQIKTNCGKLEKKR